MPTGIEEAGLVLAAVPLLFEVIHEYHHGTRLAISFFRPKKNLRSTKRMLEGQSLRFRNSLYNLFEFVFKDAGSTSRKLMVDYLGSAWKDSALESAIQETLGRGNWDIFLGVIDGIQEVILNVSNDLFKDREHTKKTIASQRLYSLTRRFRVAFGSSRTNLNDLQVLIDILESLVRGLIERPDVTTPPVDPSTFRKFRQMTADLCAAIDSNLSCSIHNSHIATLQLGISDEAAVSLNDTFQMLFQLPSNLWTAVAINPRCSNGPETVCQKIDNLCHSLQLSTSMATPSNQPLGHIGIKNAGDSFCINIQPVPCQQPQMFSLHDILNSSGAQTSQPPFAHEVVRCKIGIILAMSILGLHSTPWLPDMYTSRDIHFVGALDRLDEATILRPYLKQSFPRTLLRETTAPPILVRNTQLWALGKLYIQLVECRPLVGVQPQSQTDNCSFHQDPEAQAAIDLERSIKSKVGHTWAQVIRRCLYCDFETDSTAATLENDQFLRRVYGLIVGPLVNVLKTLNTPLHSLASFQSA